MTIIIKNKDYLIFDDFKFRCCVGKKGFSNNKNEGDMKTPTGEFSIENLYFRKDKKKIPKTRLKIIIRIWVSQVLLTQMIQRIIHWHFVN